MFELEAKQKQMLHDFIQQAEDWNVVILISRPGDSPFLAPVCPKLMGVEICADPSSGLYDIWRNGTIIKGGLRAKALARWLRKRTPSEDEYIANGEAWVEATLQRYDVPKRFDPSMN